MKPNDGAASDSFSSAEGRNSGNAQFDASVLEEAIRSLEAIGGLMEKIQQISSQGGASDAAMLQKLKKAASPGAEQKILDAVLELAAMLRTGEIPADVAAPQSHTDNQGRSNGRFRDLI